MKEMKKILIIGGTGFIGQNLSCRLIERGYDVTICARRKIDFSFPYEGKYHFIQSDIFFEDTLDPILLKFDYVFYLVCSMKPAASIKDITFGYEKDITTLIHLLDIIKHGSTRLVFISSGGTVYGSHWGNSMTENMQTFPINHYGILKLTQEKIIAMYNEKYHMKNIIFRVSNPYGHGQKRASGIGAVTAFLEAILSGQTIKIYGDGNTIRDYIYISDVVEMIIQYIEKSICVDRVPIYNIGTGVGTSLNMLVGILENITGEKASIEYDVKRDVDVERNVLSTDKIKRVIGDYQCVSLANGVKEYYKIIEKERI